MKIRRRSRRKSSPTRTTTDHRKPPRPPTWDSPRGWCRFCGLPILDDSGAQNMRRNWHKGEYVDEPDCVSVWKIANDPKYAREFVFHRDGGKCSSCGCQVGINLTKRKIIPGEPFEVDHVRPLFMAHGDLSYWHPDNLISRCVPCHKEKTRLDMIEYRILKETQND